MKKLLALTAAAVAALAIPAFAAPKTVSVGDNYFVSKGGSHKITVKKGSTVKWVWSAKNKNEHNAYQTDGPGHFHTPTHKKSRSFSHKFTQTGTYRFICTYETMKLTVRVVK